MKPIKHAELVALDHMARFGAWLPEDPFRVRPATLDAMEKRGWVLIDRMADGSPVCAVLTPLGRAASVWGAARLFEAA